MSAKKPQRARPTSGEQAAVALALEHAPAAPPKEPEPEQADWIEDLIGAPETKALREARMNHAARGRGRPQGVRNKRTVEWTEYLLSRYASPLEVLAQIATMGIEELVASLGCTKLEALQEKRLAALGLLPYVHAKQPVAIDVTKRQIVNLNIVVEEGEGEAPPTDDDVISIAATVVEKLTDGRDAQSQLEIPGPGGDTVHAVREASPDPQRTDRRG